MLKVLLLGLIDISAMTGYDLKKIFDTSMIFFWHATHTQIYNTLKDMEKEGLIVSKVIYNAAGPSKRVFSITEAGKSELKDQLLKEPQLAGIKHDFMVKMSFFSNLPDDVLLKQLDAYENKIKEKLSELEGERKQEFMALSRNRKETLLWLATFDYGLLYYANELNWIEKVKQRLTEFTGSTS